MSDWKLKLNVKMELIIISQEKKEIYYNPVLDNGKIEEKHQVK